MPEFATRAEISHVRWGGAKVFGSGLGSEGTVGHRGGSDLLDPARQRARLRSLRAKQP
jgi:hypothetical protein